MNRPFCISLLCLLHLISHFNRLPILFSPMRFLATVPGRPLWGIWMWTLLILATVAGLIAAPLAMRRSEKGRKALVGDSILMITILAQIILLSSVHLGSLVWTILLHGGTIWYFTRRHVREYYQRVDDKLTLQFTTTLDKSECVRRLKDRKYKEVTALWKNNDRLVIAKKVTGRDPWSPHFFGQLVQREDSLMIEGYVDFAPVSNIFITIWLGVICLIGYFLLMDTARLEELVMLIPFVILVTFGGTMEYFGRRSGRKKVPVLIQFIERELQGTQVE